jgi:hypothetical protein
MPEPGFSCVQCGAPLTVPPDPHAMAAACPYCKRENPLPPHVLAHRQQQIRDAQSAQVRMQAMQHHQAAVKSSRRLGLWITLGTMIPIMAIVGMSIYFSMRSSFESPRYVQTPSPPQPVMRTPEPKPVATPAPTKPPAPEKPPKDPKLVQDRMTAMMKAKMTAGCARVLIEPSRKNTAQKLTATMSKGVCSVTMVVSSRDDAKIAMHIKTPVGEDLPGPAPSHEMTFGLCASTAGPHIIIVEPDTDDYFLIGSLDCPARVAKTVNAPAKK